MRFAALVPVTGGDSAADIARALGSIRAQTWADVAIYVYYSGPANAAVDQVLAPFAAAPDCQVLRNPALCSAAMARNALMDAAGEHVHAFLDSDDEWLPQHLADFAALYADLDPDWQTDTANCFYFTDYRQRQSQRHVRFGPPQRRLSYLLRQPVLLSSVITARLKLEFPAIRAEDFAFSHAALQTAGRVIHNPEIRVIYDQQRRRHKGIGFKIRRTFRLMDHIVENKPAALGLTLVFLTRFLWRTGARKK